MTLQIIQCEQGTPEWHQARAGVITASETDNVLAAGRNGKESLTRMKYLHRIAAERILGEPVEIWEGNRHSERGKELEPKARELYATKTGNNPETVGFLKSGFVGCSPDGLVGTNGGCEIKTKLPYLQLAVLDRGEVPSDNMGQVQMSLWVSGREWWDFVSFWPGLPLFVKRVYRDEVYIAEIKAGCERFNEEAEKLVEKIKGMY